MYIPVRTVKLKHGPHVAKKEFYFNGKWHWLKWISKNQLNTIEQKGEPQKCHKIKI